ncbi:integration host factor, actinobacterial type [Streptomyces niveus]|uniref:integration host factor, actinobacterial type n=1 Tax=Streptomyces niveus TaxID=193462 RepID=UPI0036969941
MALEKAIAVRRERGDVLAALKDGRLTLDDVLKRKDPVIAKTYVRRLLESLRAGQLLSELSISEHRRVQGLGTRQKARLLELFPPPG